MSGRGLSVGRGTLRGARWSLMGLFVVNGLTLGAWAARLPAIREAVDVSLGELGLVLLAGHLAGMPTMLVSPHIVALIGQHHAVRLAGVLYAGGYLLMGLGCLVGSVPVLVLGLLVQEIAWMLYGFTTDLASTVLERRLGRPAIPQLHAGFGIGMVVGSVAGGGASALGVALPAWFCGLAVVALVWRLVSAGRLLDDAAVPRRLASEDPSSDGGTADAYGLLDAWRDPRTLLLGAVLVAAVTSELAAVDWIPLAMVDGRGAAGWVAALALTMFVLALTLVRLAGAFVVVRLGRVRTMRVGALVAITGVLVFALSPSGAGGMLGAAAWGAGTALNIPLTISACSDEPVRTGHRLVVVTVLGNVPLLAVPAGIGALAEVVGVRYALVAVAGALAVVVALADRMAAAPVAVRSGPGPG